MLTSKKVELETREKQDGQLHFKSMRKLKQEKTKQSELSVY
ncbi:MAG: hypothetical protein R6U44_02845 [Archaeoglobaceae archaeon]